MTDTAECHRCRAVYALKHPITFEVQGFLADERAFCSPSCAALWALGEVQRLRGWMRRIFVRCGGVAGRLARKGLQTNLHITDDV